jgi:hypothetical protein
MKISRLFAVLSVVAVALGAVPVLAEGETLPAACGGVAPTLAEGEALQEHTVYLHGKNPVGEQDGVDDLLASRPSGTYMDATAPTEPVSKVDNNMATAGNDEFNGNPLLSYWAMELEEPARIVCASGSVFTTDNGNPTFQLFFDQPYSTATIGATTSSTGTGAGIRTATGAFKPFDVPVDFDVTFQVIASRPGAQMLYDSTTHPSSFSYVTVVPAPEPTEAPSPVLP